MMGRSVAAFRCCTTSMYPKDGEVDLLCCGTTPIILQKQKSVFLNSLLTIHVHVVYTLGLWRKRFSSMCTITHGPPNTI